MRNSARRVQLLPDDAGPVSYMFAVGLSYFILPKEGLVPGQDVEAILARAEHWMREGDLDAAAREVNSLKGWPKRLAKDWLKEATQRLEVEQVVDVCLCYFASWRMYDLKAKPWFSLRFWMPT